MIATTRGWAKESTLSELKNILDYEEALKNRKIELQKKKKRHL